MCLGTSQRLCHRRIRYISIPWVNCSYCQTSAISNDNPCFKGDCHATVSSAARSTLSPINSSNSRMYPEMKGKWTITACMSIGFKVLTTSGANYIRSNCSLI
ncbi:hypothetical protein E1A91_D07G171800v1 [Gossypium mustelinum]|uniref:Uncharacterized protein n=1 Tax=Gossypium mustelinum TaxID=34275 RepID=A0A5D2U8Y6_GOSMU|nr:hypothetical protein E1A91_D07G171800v1 [Gossypium mustelinum]